jgi:hypothetical protein
MAMLPVSQRLQFKGYSLRATAQALELQLRGGAWRARELIGLHAGKLFTSQHE